MAGDFSDIVARPAAGDEHTAGEGILAEPVDEGRMRCAFFPGRVARLVARLPINADASAIRRRCRIGIFGSVHESKMGG